MHIRRVVAALFLTVVTVGYNVPAPAMAAGPFRMVQAGSCYDPRTDSELSTDRSEVAKDVLSDIVSSARNALLTQRSQLAATIGSLADQWTTQYSLCISLYQRDAAFLVRCPPRTVSTNLAYINACNSEGVALDREYGTLEDQHNALAPSWDSWNAAYHAYLRDIAAAPRVTPAPVASIQPLLSYPPNAAQAPFPAAVIDIRKISNGCGGGKTSPKEQTWDTSTYLNSNNPLGKRYAVNFRAACNLHDAGYSGAAVRDEINGGFVDYFGWTKEQVDAKFLADMRKLCERQLPSTAAAAVSDCKANGGKTSLGAGSRYVAVDVVGKRYWAQRPSLSGMWVAHSGASDSSVWEIVQTGRSLTARMNGIGTHAGLKGTFSGTLITQDEVSVIKGVVTENVGGKIRTRPASITISNKQPDRVQVSGGDVMVRGRGQ